MKSDGIILDHDLFRRIVSAFAGLVLVATAFAAVAPGAETPASVIVRGNPGSIRHVEDAVIRAGGTVRVRIGIIDGVVATVPAGSVSVLRSDPGVASVVLDRKIRLLHATDGLDPSSDTGSLHNTTKLIKAQDLWRSGVTGRGVGVALIDSGVVPVDGLTVPGKVVNGPDLSFDGQADSTRWLDTYGHGTHMAGIIAGRDDSIVSSGDLTSHDSFAGVAPDARILNVKVASANGATDVSQVIAAIDWVVQHRNDQALNIRVLNLSFGTDGSQSYTDDPLAYAAEVAWRKGIVVVAAAGNAGSSLGRLNNPAYDPYVIAVGADDANGSPRVSDDVIPDWSSRGDGVRNPDVIAPGKSIVSLRDPGSYIDVTYPEGKVNARFTRGSGTSQAAAVVSGAAALLLQARPGLTPDQVKGLLVSTATPVPGYDAGAQGAGLINVRSAAEAPEPETRQTWPTSTGTGSLEQARGSVHVAIGDAVLNGEQDIFGSAWDGTTWSQNSWNGTTWSGGEWNGTTWSGNCWCGTTWSGTTWSGTTWSGTTWSGTTWSGTTWSNASWSGTTWSGTTWSGTTWSGTTWSGTTWSGTTWSEAFWSSAEWGA